MSKQRKAQGMLVTFKTSGTALRRSAQEHLRKGSRLKAVELLHMALQQEDTPETRFLLADTLYGMQCAPQAADLLYRLCTDPEPPRGVYFLLAMCLRDMGNVQGAMDALAHDLQQDSESPESDDSRMMLAELAETMDEDSSLRMLMLGLRAQCAADAGELPLARRRMRRLERIAPDKTWARERWAEMEHMAGEDAAALRVLARAMRLEPKNASCRLALCSMLGSMGRRRAACGFLRRFVAAQEAARVLARAMRLEPKNASCRLALCSMLGSMGRRRAACGFLRRFVAAQEAAGHTEKILAVAEELKDWATVKQVAQARLRSGSPFSISLLHALAEAYWHTGERERAHQLWERIIRIDPMDVRALALYRWPLDTEEELPIGDLPPISAAEEAVQRVKQAVQEGQGAQELLRLDAPLRPWIFWMLRAHFKPLQQLALCALRGEDAQTRQALREVLVLPDVMTYIRQAALLRLTELGEQGPFPMQAGGVLALAECTPTTGQSPRGWRRFRMLLLKEAGWHGHARELVEKAAEIWRRLTPAQHRRAAGEEAYLWVKTVELGWLIERMDVEGEQEVLRQLPVSFRRLDRIQREITRQTGWSPYMEGEESNEMHQL